MYNSERRNAEKYNYTYVNVKKWQFDIKQFFICQSTSNTLGTINDEPASYIQFFDLWKLVFRNYDFRRRDILVSVFLACVQIGHPNPNCRTGRCFRPVDIKTCGVRAAAVNPAMFFSNCSLTRSARQEAFQITSLFYAVELVFQEPSPFSLHRFTYTGKGYDIRECFFCSL